MKRVKNIFTAALIITLIFQIEGIAQAPEKIAYQAVVRDGTNLLLASQAIGVQITILRDAAAIYVETHSVTTNLNALLSVEVGTGSVVSGQFDTIAWRAGTLFIKADIDPSGGTAYSITGTAELLSLPFALFAKEAENGFSGDFNDLINKPNFDGSETKVTAGSKVTITGTGTAVAPYMVNAIVPVSGFEHYIGEPYGDGVIFYIYVGSDGTEYNLVVHEQESPAQLWQSVNSNTLAYRTYDGIFNTVRMINSPARTYVESFGTGWYVPSIDELSLLYQNRYQVAQGLELIGGTPISTLDAVANNYWSSTEFSSSYAWYFSMATGVAAGTPGSGANPKGNNRRVRAIQKIQPLIGTPKDGGVIGYIFQPGDPGFVQGEIHGLVVAESDLFPTIAEWGCPSPLGLLYTIGTGAANTADIVANCATPGIAPRLCDDYVNADNGTGVFTDWFLPSLDEMRAIGQNQHMLTGFNYTDYWSSTGGDSGGPTKAWQYSLATKNAGFVPKSGNYGVRPVRYF